MMNGVYELRPDEAWASKLKSGQLPEYLKPSNKIQQHSTIATAMGTTLWFTQEEKEAGVHDSLIAAGRYAGTYWNILRRSRKTLPIRMNIISLFWLVRNS